MLKLALIAFLFHAPGLRLISGYSLNRFTLKLNILAIALTVVAAFWLKPALSSWFAGHFAWSFYLAVAVYLGKAGEQFSSKMKSNPILVSSSRA